MERVETVFKSISNKYPTYRDDLLIKVPFKWLDGKRIDDNAEGLWRVHDKLYDLSDFVERHPGGKDWISLTKGIDITEQFETHHITNKAEQLLKKYYIRDAAEPRNYKFTYHENGFYKTFKKRVADIYPQLDNAPKKMSNIISDMMLAVIFVSAILTAKDNNNYMAILVGFFLNCQLVIAHNYFHRKDNWRMYTFNLSLLSYSEWRVSHAMSHHLYTNSYYDLEITMFEPHLQWIPRPKSVLQKVLSVVISPLAYALVGLLSIIHRTIGYYTKDTHFTWDHLIPFSLPLVMFYLGQPSLYLILKLWLIMVLSCSFWLGVFGLNAGHHHPDVTHEGDELPKGMDFGVYQMNAVIDRKDVKSSHFITLITFGHHTLHHFFPTLDHGLLPQLHEVFIETCGEFEVELREYPWWPLIVGQFEQLVRTKPRTLRERNLKDI